MKTSKSFLGLAIAKTVAFVALSLLVATPSHAAILASSVDLQTAGRTKEWAIFALTGGISVNDGSTTTFDTNFFPTGPYDGNPTVRGDVGVRGGSIALSGTTKVQGTAYIKQPGLLRRTGSAQINGNGGLAIQSAANNVAMDQVNTDAINASATANTLNGGITNKDGAIDAGWSSQTTIVQNTSLSLTDTTGASAVIYLTDFILSGGAVFTLSGTATTSYVFNISNKFSLLGGQIVIDPMSALKPENVLFNVVGTGTDVSFSAGAQFNGVLLATQRSINLTGGTTARGTIIGSKVTLTGNSKVLHTPFSP